MAFVSQPPSPQTLQMKVLGLYTNSNQLSAAPDGALSIADNIWISKDSIAESRRGFDFLPFTLPQPADRADALNSFQNQLLIHYNDSNGGSANDKLAYYDMSTGVHTYSGSYKHPNPLTARMKFVESNKNIYFTTSTGIFRNDAVTNTPQPAGMYQALDITATASASGSGFMSDNSQVAYRAVWGKTDANNNLILGAPSQRATISNTSGGVQNASLDITIPAGVTTDDFLQIYRSNQALGITASASLTIQDITFTAVSAATGGNAVSIKYTTGGTAGSEAVSLVGSAITIQIASGNASNKAVVIIQDLTYAAVQTGSSGNLVSVTYSGGGTAGSEVVTVSGNNVNVKMQSGSSTATQISNAINASPAALSVVTVTVSGTGSTAQTAVAPTYLNGGSTAQNIVNAIAGSAPASALVTATVTGLSTDFQTAPSGPTNLSGGSVTLIDADDSMQLVYEANPTSLEISAKTLTVVDETPDSLRGAALYTNATQQGILQQNTPPPYALDLCLFQTCMFFGNVQTPQQLFLTLISVGGSGGVQLGDTVMIAGTTYTAGVSENVGTLTYQLVTSGSPAQNINDTALSLVRVINQNSTNTTVYAYYLSGVNDLPGKMLIQSRATGSTAFSVTASADGSAWSPALPTSGISVISTNNKYLNGLMYSKAGQPDSVPSQNLIFAGSANKAILRTIPVRNSLFILKEDGVFRCTGVPGNFSIDTIDDTIIILAPESAAKLSNQVFCLTTQGVVAVSDNGGPVLSRPIENLLLELQGNGLSAFENYSFGVAYESERQFCLWTISSPSDTNATQAYIYNTFTKTWTRSTRQQTHGIVTPVTFDNKMYLVNPNSNKISVERKSYTYKDYTDEAFANTIVGISGDQITIVEVNDIEVGDRLYQSDSINSLVIDVDYTTQTVTVEDVITGWTAGACSILRGIDCLMEWLPNTAGNPGYLRHWSEVALMLKQNLFNNADLNFYSEIDISIDSVPIAGNPSIGWGQSGWGKAAWGGVVKSKPFRTLVPREKQRCDLLSIQFECRNSWGQFQIEGLSSIFMTIGSRMTL